MKLEGFDKVQKHFAQMPKQLQQVVTGELEDGANAIAEGAKRDVPVDTGFLKNSISVRRLGNLTFEVVAQANYAAYVEFGTGTLVNVPAGLESYAIQFKGKGMSQVNLPARPYLISNYLRQRPEIVKQLKALVNNL